MDEVTRYRFEELCPTGETMVMGSDYDAALSQLAALREELATSNAAHEVAAENHGLLNTKIFNLEQRLADAERRNLELVELLTHAHIAIHTMEPGFFLLEKIDATLNKPEEAKSCCGQFPKCVCSEGADGL